MVTVGILPGFLLAALAVLVRRDMPLTETHLGFSVACGFTASALLSAPAGRVTSRIGSRMGFVVASGGVATGLALITFAQSWLQLAIGLTVAGCGNAFMQVAANLRIARAVAPGRHGVAFGVKQSAIPGATMVAGVAVPTIAVTLGWRSTFAMATASAVLIMGWQLVQSRGSRTVEPGPIEVTASTMPPELVRPVRAFTLGVGCAAAAATSLGTFLPEFAVGRGWTPENAGFLLAAGSALCITSRVSFGLRIDTRPARGFPWVVVQLAAGAASLVVLALSSGAAATLVPAVLVAFAAGWGWSGLFNFAIVREAPEAPATVTGRTQAGVFAGGGAGPLLFGVIATRASYETAWLAAATCMAVGGALIARGQRVLARQAAMSTA